MTTVAEMRTEILTGEFDAELDIISGFVKSRKQMLNDAKFHSLSVGDRVKFNGGVKPKYMIGVVGEVVERMRTKVMVRLEGGNTGRFSGEVRCPVSVLDKIA